MAQMSHDYFTFKGGFFDLMCDSCRSAIQAAAIDHLDCLQKFKTELPSESLWKSIAEDQHLKLVSVL